MTDSMDKDVLGASSPHAHGQSAPGTSNAELLLSAIGGIGDDILLDAMPAAIAAGVAGAGTIAAATHAAPEAAASQGASGAAGASSASAAGSTSAAGDAGAATHGIGAALGALGISKAVAAVAACAVIAAGVVVGVNVANNGGPSEGARTALEQSMQGDSPTAQGNGSASEDEPQSNPENESAESQKEGDEATDTPSPEEGTTKNTASPETQNPSGPGSPSVMPPAPEGPSDNPGGSQGNKPGDGSSGEEKPQPAPSNPVTVNYSYMRSSLEARGAIPSIPYYQEFICKAHYGKGGALDYVYMLWTQTGIVDADGNPYTRELFVGIAPSGSASAKAELSALAPASPSKTRTFNSGGDWYLVSNSAYGAATLVDEVSWFFEANPFDAGLLPKP